MSKIAFQGTVTILETFATATADRWEFKISLSDTEGQVTPYSIQPGDILVFDSSFAEARTLVFYKLVEITNLDWQAPTVLVEYLDINDHVNGSPNMMYRTNISGIITRDTFNKHLLPIISSDAQNLPDRFASYIMNYNLKSILDKMETASNSLNGSVFITDVQPQNSNLNVGDKVYSDGGTSLLGCSSTTNLVRVSVLALTGHSKYKPSVNVNGSLVNLNAKADAPLFEGTVNISLDGSGLIVATHEDGPKWQTTVAPDVPPIVSSAVFLNNAYPGTQTELKENDEVSVNVSSDLEFVKVEIDNFGALKPKIIDVSAATTVNLNNLQIANRGYAALPFGFRLRVQKDNGTWSEWFESDVNLGTDGVDYVILNNLKPTINVSSITYPTGQSALKNAEQAIVNHTINNYDFVTYSSSQLLINNINLYEPAKAVTRQSGGYVDTGYNFNITAQRSANGSSVSTSELVVIANTKPTVEISIPYKRLRSGGTMGTSAQTYTVSITSDQKLLHPPTVNIPEGQWVGSGFIDVLDSKVWTRQISIHDNNAKGIFSFNGLSAVNLSGLETINLTGSYEYEIGGFVIRTIQVDAYPNRSSNIGTAVVNTSKLRCTNLSKGDSGSLNYTFDGTLNESIDKFTIVNSNDTLQSDGQYWYNLDGPNAASNTTGEMLVEIEEVI